ncbi:MAG: hypothetical protein PH343_08790 [Nitrospira sp.]|jgi:hypothetical protein|nr:hypothetical protein [Nitrospira sp.]
MSLSEEQRYLWNKYIASFIIGNCKEMVFAVMGQNGISFLEAAKDEGFSQVIGMESYTEGHFSEFPLADYTLLFESHYLFTINDWLDYLDELQYKTRYCILVTSGRENKQRCWTSSETQKIRNYFKAWKEVGFIDEIPAGFCFESPFLERVLIESLDCGNHVQDQFYSQLEEGIDYKETRYYHIIKHYRRNRWSEERLDRWFEERIKVWESVKKRQLIRPIYVGEGNHILDGNHRYAMMRTLGFKTILVRRT